jgi:hypothetical protein
MRSRPRSPEVSGKRKSIRGGSWCLNPDLARASDRGGPCPSLRHIFIGFRCVRGAAPIRLKIYGGTRRRAGASTDTLSYHVWTCVGGPRVGFRCVRRVAK